VRSLLNKLLNVRDAVEQKNGTCDKCNRVISRRVTIL